MRLLVDVSNTNDIPLLILTFAIVFCLLVRWRVIVFNFQYTLPLMNLYKLQCFPGIIGVIMSAVECTLCGDLMDMYDMQDENSCYRFSCCRFKKVDTMVVSGFTSHLKHNYC